MQCPYKQLRQITDTIQMPADQKTRTLQTKLCGQQCCLYERNCSISVRACVTRIPLTQSLKKRNRRATLESKKQQVHGDMAQKEFTVWHIRCFLHLVHWTVSLCSMTKKKRQCHPFWWLNYAALQVFKHTCTHKKIWVKKCITHLQKVLYE